ncbi:hypothetical protein ACLMAJ_28435 [Nocardia sp. KC 131]|uniref:hypothetical protein n=1 Tax=Nocardia arseniciresistens TaxID=3392119 RepID=UPI00398E8DF4
MIDSALGFAPSEIGPKYSHIPAVPIPRLRTLLLKWAIMVGVAPVVSGVYIAVGHLLEMPLNRPWELFLYGAFAIVAVGITALSILAALGSAGLLVNRVLFIVLGLPSSGGTIPIEATPKAVAWLANFEPMHQVFLGTRAILFFDGPDDAGLSRAVWMTMLGLVVGLVLGGAVTRLLRPQRTGPTVRPSSVD